MTADGDVERCTRRARRARGGRAPGEFPTPRRPANSQRYESASVRTRTENRFPATASIRSRESSTKRTRTGAARVLTERFPARSTARNRISYVPGPTTRPLTRPNQTSLPSSARNLLCTRCRPSTSISARARSSIRYVAVTRSRLPSESGREHPREHANERDPRSSRIDADRVRQDDRPAVAFELHAWAVDPFGDDAVEVVTPVPRVRDATCGLAALPNDGSNRSTVLVQHVERHGLAPAQDERDHRHIARALAYRRKDTIDLGARDRAPLELQPLGDGEGRSGCSEQRKDEQELWPPRHESAARAARARAREQRAPRARSRSSRRRTPMPRGSRARCADADTRGVRSRSGRTRPPSARWCLSLRRTSSARTSSVLPASTRCSMSAHRSGAAGPCGRATGRVATATESKSTR